MLQRFLPRIIMRPRHLLLRGFPARSFVRPRAPTAAAAAAAASAGALAATAPTCGQCATAGVDDRTQDPPAPLPDLTLVLDGSEQAYRAIALRSKADLPQSALLYAVTPAPTSSVPVSVGGAAASGPQEMTVAPGGTTTDFLLSIPGAGWFRAQAIDPAADVPPAAALYAVSAASSPEHHEAMFAAEAEAVAPAAAVQSVLPPAVASQAAAPAAAMHSAPPVAGPQLAALEMDVAPAPVAGVQSAPPPAMSPTHSAAPSAPLQSSGPAAHSGTSSAADDASPAESHKSMLAIAGTGLLFATVGMCALVNCK